MFYANMALIPLVGKLTQYFFRVMKMGIREYEYKENFYIRKGILQRWFDFVENS